MMDNACQRLGALAPPFQAGAPDPAWNASAALPDAQWMVHFQARIESVLGQLLPAASGPLHALAAAMRHSTLGGGKRLRPLLAYAAGHACAAPLDCVDRVAAALEMVHVFSLIHDDLPCMDDDVLRRGKPTCHVAHGEGMALLAGDALQSLAFELLAEPCPALAAQQQVAMLGLLGKAAGAGGISGGQAIDHEHVGAPMDLAALEHMHRLKTGRLIHAAIALGAAAGARRGAAELAALDRFAGAIGLAFQVVDDVLDAVGDTAQLGKSAGKDALHDKPTFVRLLGVEGARARARALEADAIDALAVFGEDGRRLVGLTRFIVSRNC